MPHIATNTELGVIVLGLMANQVIEYSQSPEFPIRVKRDQEYELIDRGDEKALELITESGLKFEISIKLLTTSTFICPKCGRESHNPHDVEEGYCGNCHAYTGLPEEVTGEQED